MYSIIVVPPPTREDERNRGQTRLAPGERLTFGRSAHGDGLRITHDGVSRRAGEISPALIAAMLRVESDFDPGLSDPDAGEEGEYGIARWTPRVLRWWTRADGVPAKETPRPPLTPFRVHPGPWPASCASSNRVWRPG